MDSAAPDPLDPVHRLHEGIYVEVDQENGRGILFHVTGDIIFARGMQYETKSNWRPRQSSVLVQATPIGHVLKSEHDSGKIDAVLSALPRPLRKQGLNFWGGKNPATNMHDIIWVKEDGEPYGPGDQRRPIFKCNEWVHEHAIPALQRERILRK